MKQDISWSGMLSVFSVIVLVREDQNFSDFCHFCQHLKNFFASADVLLTAGYFGSRRYLDFILGLM